VKRLSLVPKLGCGLVGGLLCLSLTILAAPACARFADAQFDEGVLTLGGGPGAVACAEVGVTNVGDEYLDDICFHSPGCGGIIPYDAFEFIPPCMSLAPGETETLRICVGIPLGIQAGLYQGAAYLQAASGSVNDVVQLDLFVECVPELNIPDDWGDVIGNEMVLAVALGESTQGTFRIENVGNCALTEMEGPAPTGPPLIVVPHVPSSCEWEETVPADIGVRLVEPGLPVGSYGPIVFAVTAEGGAIDYFLLVIDVVTSVEPASWSRVKALFGSP
jgi:hypothetical protein